MTENIVWHNHQVSNFDREKLLNQKGVVLWFTGISGSGKSTIANAVSLKLHDSSKLTYILDGDNVRHGLNSDLGFSDDDRIENIRRIGEVSKLFVDAGVIVLTAFISPFVKDRDNVRNLVGDKFVEVFVDCALEECEKRDPKGLYKKARAGEIKKFTGIDSPYEKPNNPELTVDTKKDDVDTCVNKILSYLEENGYTRNN